MQRQKYNRPSQLLSDENSADVVNLSVAGIEIGSYYSQQSKRFFCESICNEIANIFNFPFQMMIRSVPIFFHHCLFLFHGLK